MTASHNPARYNGFKFSRHEARPVSGDHGIPLMEEKVAAGELPPRRPAGDGPAAATSSHAYREHVLSFLAPPQGGRRLKVVIDAANGMGTLYRPILDAHGAST